MEIARSNNWFKNKNKRNRKVVFIYLEWTELQNVTKYNTVL